ncbi:MAG TPA: Hpt domain-containing protein [Phycisphaerae bacterium]|jgi:HPt (histidine-containing phosphotransfer) domain-containing protein
MESPIDNPPHRSLKAEHPDVKEILPAYVGRLPRHVERLGELYAAGNFGELRILAHQLKGSGTSYGFERISALAGELEDKIANDEGAAEIGPVVEALRTYMRNVEGYST